MARTPSDYFIEYIRLVLESESIDEFSGAGAVAGYSLPLGMVPSPPVQPSKLKTGRKRKKKSKK